MIDFAKIFLFSDGDRRGAFRAQNSNELLTKEFLFGTEDDGVKVDFCWLHGSKFYDFIATGYSGVYLVSEKVCSILQVSKYRGFSLRPIILEDKKKQVVDGYRLLSVVCEVGPIINEKSIKKIMPPRVPWADPYEAYVGLYFDPSTWDGSHFFHPAGTSLIYVVEKVKQLFEENQVSNCRFDKIVDLENYAII